MVVGVLCSVEATLSLFLVLSDFSGVLSDNVFCLQLHLSLDRAVKILSQDIRFCESFSFLIFSSHEEPRVFVLAEHRVLQELIEVGSLHFLPKIFQVLGPWRLKDKISSDMGLLTALSHRS